MATYVLVHGGAHGGWCYQRVARILRSAGHDVYTPTMTGVGERSHLFRADIDLDLHIGDILAVLHYEDLRDVILVEHSYGGMVITGVADRAPDRVGHIVYPDAATPVNGESLVDIAGPLMKAARSQARVIDGVELVLFPGDRTAGAALQRDRPRRHRLDAAATHPPSLEVLRATAAAHERGGAVGDPADPHPLHLDAARA